MDRLWDHGDTLISLLDPVDVGSICIVDRSHAVRAKAMWLYLDVTGPSRIVDQWFQRWVPCEERMYYEMVELAAWCREALPDAAPSVVLFDELWGSKCRHWMGARSLDRLSLEAEHDLCDHRRPFDCRKVKIGTRGKTFYRKLVTAVLDRILRITATHREDAIWLAYCMLGLEVRWRRYMDKLYVPGWPKLQGSGEP